MGISERWKYLVVKVSASWTGCVSNERLQTELDNHGNAGWELVDIIPVRQGYSGLKLVFKRRV